MTDADRLEHLKLAWVLADATEQIGGTGAEGEA